MKRILVACAAVLAGLLSLSVTATQAPAGPAAPPETVIVLQGVDAVTLDPHQTSSLPEANILLHIFDTLTTYDDTMKLIPGVAESFRNLPNDRSVWEFKLRANVRFSNGEPLDANAVKYSFERGMNPQIGRGNTTYLNNNLGVREVRVVDPLTVHIVTRVPSPVVPGFLTEYNLVPPKYYSETSAAQVATRPIGSGPYRLVEWRKDEQVVLEVNPAYWGPRPGPRRIVWRPVPESSSRLNELIRGNADIVVNVPPDLVEPVGRVQKVASIQGGRRIFIGITQYNHAALRDRRVRQALNYAVDVDAITKGVLKGFGKRTGSTVNPPWQSASIKPYPFDQQRAGQLLDEVGWRVGPGGIRVRDGQQLSLTLMGPNGRYLKDRDVTQAIGAYLQQIGINLTVKIIDWPQYIPVILQKKADDLYMIGSGTNFEGQADISDLQFNSSSNYGNWRNDEFERSWQQLVGEFDPQKRREILSRMQETVREDAPYIFLYFQVDIYGISNRVTWQPLPNERIRLFRASVERQ